VWRVQKEPLATKWFSIIFLTLRDSFPTPLPKSSPISSTVLHPFSATRWNATTPSTLVPPSEEEPLNSEALAKGTRVLGASSKGLNASTNSPNKPVTSAHKTTNGFGATRLLFPPPCLIFTPSLSDLTLSFLFLLNGNRADVAFVCWFNHCFRVWIGSGLKSNLFVFPTDIFMRSEGQLA